MMLEQRRRGGRGGLSRNLYSELDPAEPARWSGLTRLLRFCGGLSKMLHMVHFDGYNYLTNDLSLLMISTVT
jgi:hypothetical protein